MEDQYCVFDYRVNVGDVVQCMVREREPQHETGNTSRRGTGNTSRRDAGNTGNISRELFPPDSVNTVVVRDSEEESDCEVVAVTQV